MFQTPNGYPKSNFDQELAMQMLVAPSWQRTLSIMQSELIFAPIALSYLFLLVHSWQPDTIQLVLPGSLKAGLTGTISASSACHER